VFDPPDGQWATPPEFPAGPPPWCPRWTTCTRSGGCSCQAGGSPMARASCRAPRSRP
jgi:hypothetical protein